jgi:hypothetical protein
MSIVKGGRAMKYDVHIFAIVRVKVAGISAESQAEAIDKAENSVDLYRILDNPGGVGVQGTEFADGISHYLVDEVGDSTYRQSRFYEPDGKTVLDFSKVAARAIRSE